MLISPEVLVAGAREVMRDNELAMTLELSVLDGIPLVSRPTRTIAGGASSVDTPSEPATLHTHSVWNYRNQLCFVGWPSGEDMRWILAEARSQQFAVHVCVAIEGSYVITANPAIRLVDYDHERVSEMIYRVFSSTHGRRCGDGAARSVFPDARYFQRLVRSLGAGLPCAHYAGSELDCAWDAGDEAAWRRFTEGLERISGTRLPFECAFIPHVLVGRDGARYSHEQFWSDPAAHIRRIVDHRARDAYVDVVADHPIVRISRCLYGAGASHSPGRDEPRHAQDEDARHEPKQGARHAVHRHVRARGARVVR
jgi:hypothetical protein